jgi:MBG domain-containing protein
VLRKALTITASSPDDVIYGSAKPTVSPIYDGFISGDNADSLGTKPTCGTGYSAGSAIGTYATSCSGASAHNYEIDYVAGSFHVLKKALTITASSPDDITYGDAAPTVTASYEGFITGDSADSLGTKPTCGTGYSVGNPVGTYPTSCSGAEATNYDIHYADGSFKVLKKALTITASSPDDIVYGSAKPTVSPIYDGFISGDSADSLSTKPSCDTGYAVGSSVGSYTTACSGAEAHDYEIAYVNGSFHVLKKALTITASSPDDVVYGSAAPAVTPSYDGFISGDDESSLDTKPTCGTGYSVGSAVGTYATSCSGASAQNYEIGYADGSFHVLKKALTITASSPGDIVYGSPKPTVTPLYDGFISGDNADSLGTKPTCDTGYSAGDPVGHYGASCAGATSGNYDISYAGGAFDVTKKALTITASSPADIAYGSAAPTITPSYDGFIAGDGPDKLLTKPTCGTDYAAGNDVGPYATTCSGAASGNYGLSYAAGSFTVLKKALTITASSPDDIVYGSAKPTVNPIYDGFISGDDAGKLTTQPSCGTAYSPGYGIGTYATTCSGAAAGNYDISYAAGSFKVTKKALTITASSPADVVYGSAKPAVTATPNGLVAGDALGDLNAGCGTPYSAGNDVGTYATSCAAAGGKSPNYDITYVGGSFRVTKKSLTITASSPADIAYGAAKPGVTAAPSGLVAGDTIADLNVACTTGYSAGDPIGTYATSCAASGGKSGNYDITYVNGSFKVTKKSLTITASSPADVVYGSAKPAVTANAAGLIAQDALADLNLTCGTPYAAGDPVGAYATNCSASGGKSGNYGITYVGGSFNVTKKTLTITASSPADVTYGAAAPPVTPLYSGFISGQDASSLATKPTCGTTYTSGSPVGTYATSCSGAASGNYAFVYVAGSFKVVYGWSGFLQPINDTAHFVSLSMSVFKAGSTIPVKFQLQNAAGASVQATTLPQWVTPTVIGTTSAPIDETVYSDPPSSGSTYRWDGQQYIFNWQSPKADVGKIYRIGVRLDDGRTYYVNIGLR